MRLKERDHEEEAASRALEMPINTTTKVTLAITGLITRRIRSLDREARSAQHEIHLAIEAVAVS